MKDYRIFVDSMVKKHNARWAGVILKDGSVPAYAAKDEECKVKCLRTAKSFYWTVMSMGEMIDLPDLEGRYLEIIWKQGDSHIYVYIFIFEDEVVMISTDKKMEEYFVELMECILSEVEKLDLPGMVAFVTADLNGKIVDTFLDRETITSDEEADWLIKKAESLLKEYIDVNASGESNCKYWELTHESFTAWLFPYKEKIAIAIFTTAKVDSMFNLIYHLLELSGNAR